MGNVVEVFPGETRILVVNDDSDLRLTPYKYLDPRNFIVSSSRLERSSLFRHPSYQGRPLIQNIDIVRFLTDLPVPVVGKNDTGSGVECQIIDV
jgi:hypothetical protein